MNKLGLDHILTLEIAIPAFFLPLLLFLRRRLRNCEIQAGLQIGKRAWSCVNFIWIYIVVEFFPDVICNIDTGLEKNSIYLYKIGIIHVIFV